MNSAKGKRRLVLDFIDKGDYETINVTANNISMHDVANGAGHAAKYFIESNRMSESHEFVAKMAFVYDVACALELDYIAGLIKQGFEDAGVDISGAENFSTAHSESVH